MLFLEHFLTDIQFRDSSHGRPVHLKRLVNKDFIVVFVKINRRCKERISINCGVFVCSHQAILMVKSVNNFRLKYSYHDLMYYFLFKGTRVGVKLL